MALIYYKRTLRHPSVALSLMLLCISARAQVISAKHFIHLNNGDITLVPNASKWLDSMKAFPASTPALAFVHFNTLPSAEEKEQLKKQGITLLDYLPDNTYAAHIQLSAGNNTSPAPVYSITDIKPEWKADNYIWKKVASQKGTTEVLVTFYNDIKTDEIKQFINTIGGQIHASPMEKYGAYKILIDASQLRAIASWYGVQNISPVTEMVPFDLQSRPAVKGNNAVSPISIGGYGLDGTGVTVGVGDNCSGIYHADLKDRIINFNPVGKGTHGTHVNGIVGGAGIIDPLAQGMAPNVGLVDYFFDLILPSTGAMYRDYNMTITNNSYGVILNDCDYSGTYDGYAHFLDTLSIQYPDVLHVFASGNDGGMSCSPYPQGFATVGGGYQPAKNNVVVGSMTDYLYQAGDESRGPTKDGRMKPEIVAVGLGAYSCIKEDEYEWAAGTSMAAPQVAGGLAILTQRYKQLYPGTQPKADVLKAILLNGATDLGNPGPDFTYGFGSMDVSRSLKIIDSSWFYTNTANNNDSQYIYVNVLPNTAQLKVLVTWQDMPASPASAKQLVNDLDLSVLTPGSVTHFPLVPDHTPANVKNDAVEKVDHLNNTEQVIINNPVPGVYSIKVKGYNVPYPAQRYVVAIDKQPNGIQLTYPLGGEAISDIDTATKDSVRIFWDAAADGNSFKVEFTDNGGASWITLANALPSTERYFPWRPFGYSSEKCQIRVSKNGTSEVSTSGRFVINKPTTLSLDTAQCPGYINISWHPVANATGYELLAKQGAQMVVTDVITDTFYSFKNMPLTRKSYVAVRPLINGVQGYRSLALSTIANSGNCTKPVSFGDLMIEKVTAPQSGRKYTYNQLGTNETLSLKVRNLYNTACNNYAITYTINGGTWQTYTSGPAIPAHSTTTVSIPGNDLSTTGSYTFTIAITNLSITDPLHQNDTFVYTIKNLPNDTLILPFTDGFESMGIVSVTGKDSIGITPDGRWDFQTYDSAGRVRSFVNSDVTITGDRSISMDENQNVKEGGYSTLLGTFNLAGYDTSNAEIRLDFDYILHGAPKRIDGNKVIIKSLSTESWRPFFTYNLNAYPGFVNKAKSLSITDAVRATDNNFSQSLTIGFGQNDTSLIAAYNYGNGITLDNVKLYTVANDAQLTKIVSPVQSNCGITGYQPVTVEVRNGVNYPLYNVQVFFKMDTSSIIYAETIDTILAKQTVSVTFTQRILIPIGIPHQINAWINASGDTYRDNDSILQYKFRNNPIVSSFPYLENFETGNGGYYAEGVNSSWQYGTPASTKINKAASGIKAWKTNLTGRYNNLEQSYLYTPCFDISTLSNPMLSFSTAMDIENCGGTMCDKGFVEYTTDGISWTKLGKTGEGTNWYDSTFNVWNTNGFSRWHVASIPIPAGNVTMSFRFVLASDPGATYEGIAIDDIHIFDKKNSIFPATGVTTVEQNVNGNTWVNFLKNGQVLAGLKPFNVNFGPTAVNLYEQENIANPSATQFTFPRSYSIENSTQPVNTTVRLYLLDKDFIAAINDTTCPSCPAVTDAYSLGLTQYQNFATPATQNGTLADDTGGTHTYYPYNRLKWVPVDNGYYCEVEATPFTEYWFNTGGPTGTFPAGIDYLNFVAYKKGNDVQTYWYSLIDTVVNTYKLERSGNGHNFASVLDTIATRSNPGKYAYTEQNEFPASDTVYYRLKWTVSGKADTFISPVRMIQKSDEEQNLIALNAQMSGKGKIRVDWTSYLDGIATNYLIERQINNGIFTTIHNTKPSRHYGQQYSILDAPADAVNGDIISYRLTATLDDGSVVTAPIRTVEWATPNTIASIYPNPSYDGTLNITWYAEPGTNLQLNIIDITGKSMYNATIQASHWKNTTTLQMPYQPKGVYILRTDIGGLKNIQKIVFE